MKAIFVMPNTPFWTAFTAGLAMPTLIYAPPPPYMAYAQLPPPIYSFAVVGALMSQALGAQTQRDDA
jgi:hypothetical protein